MLPNRKDDVLARGYIFYNQAIPADEPWSETLKRAGLIIWQLGFREDSEHFALTVFVTASGALVKQDSRIVPDKEILRTVSKWNRAMKH